MPFSWRSFFTVVWLRLAMSLKVSPLRTVVVWARCLVFDLRDAFWLLFALPEVLEEREAEVEVRRVDATSGTLTVARRVRSSSAR